MAKKAKEEKKRPNEPAAVVSFWLNEISTAKKREKDYRTDGERILKIYSGDDKSPYNILFSNTETLLPALYSAVPRPVVQRRFKDSDPLGQAAAMAAQRVLEFLVDTNVDGYETFDEGVRAATLDGLLPGRGVTCVKYDADIGVLKEEEPEAPEDQPEEAEPQEPAPPSEYKKSELVCIDSRSWNRVYFGYAKKWSKVPWIAYEEYIDKDEAVRLFGDETAKKLTFTDVESNDEEKKSSSEKDKGGRKACLVYQIWDKDDGRKIRYVSPQYMDGYIAVLDDPLNLTGFFNQPKPLQFMEKANDLMPTSLYVIYENQAKELNSLTLRINRIVNAIKAKAIYDGELGDDLKKLVEADDLMMVPADKTSALSAEKGLQNAIWFWPVEQLIATLVQLYQAREQCKRVIYEITGISDIIRGSSVASETATAQNIKSQWGTLRLKRLQKEVQRYARDLLRMMLEIAATKFSEDTWAKMTGLPYLTTEQRAQAEQISQALKAQGQQFMANVQPGQPPPPIPPQVQQQIQQNQADLAKPVWGQVLETLKNDTQRAYRIDIETNSTVEPEAVEDQKNISDLMTAIGQFLNGVGPLVAKGVMPFEAAQSMLLAITRRFRFGSEIEDQIKAMKAPPPEDNGQAGEQAKLLAQQQTDAAQMAHEKEMGSLKAQFEAADNAEQRKYEEWKAKLDAETKIAVAEIAAKAQVKVSAMSANAQADETTGKVDEAGQSIPGTSLAELIAASNKNFMQLIQAQGDAHRQMMGEMVKAVTAPRTRQVVRDADGKISHAVESVAA